MDGGWGLWTLWTACSASCVGGLQTRDRVCDTPVPAHGGLTCQGRANETQACNDYLLCPGNEFDLRAAIKMSLNFNWLLFCPATV